MTTQAAIVSNEGQDKNKDVGVEIDTSNTEETPIRFNISSYGWDTDVEGLVKRLNRQDIYVPHFQRKFVWSNTEKARFVESLIIGLPVPSIFLATDSDTKKMNIIDGQQRLLTLQKYFAGEFALNAPDIQPELKGRYYKIPEGRKSAEILSEKDRRSLENSLIHAVVIKHDSVAGENAEAPDFDDAIIQIFKRLNTSGKALQPQEVRACIYHGALNNLLLEINQDATWREIFGPEHSRLKDIEAILRFFALNSSWTKYKAPMPKFLNVFMKANREIGKEQYSDMKDVFVACVRAFSQALGSNVFKTSNTFLLSRFDAMMVGLATRMAEKDRKVISDLDIQKAFKTLLDDPEYQVATKEFVNDTDQVPKRIKAAIRIFSES